MLDVDFELAVEREPDVGRECQRVRVFERRGEIEDRRSDAERINGLRRSRTGSTMYRWDDVRTVPAHVLACRELPAMPAGSEDRDPMPALPARVLAHRDLPTVPAGSEERDPMSAVPANPRFDGSAVSMPGALDSTGSAGRASIDHVLQRPPASAGRCRRSDYKRAATSNLRVRLLIARSRDHHGDQRPWNDVLVGRGWVYRHL